MLFFIMPLATRTEALTANIQATPMVPQIDIEVFRADPLLIDLLVKDGTALADMDNVTTITFLVKETEFTATALMSQTKSSFTAGSTGKNCQFSFTGAECNLSLAKRRRNEFYAVVYAIQSDGQKKTIAAGKLIMVWDGQPTNIGDPPENPDYLLTEALAAASYLKYSGAQSLTAAQMATALENMGVTITAGGYLRLQNADGDVFNIGLTTGEPPA